MNMVACLFDQIWDDQFPNDRPILRDGCVSATTKEVFTHCMEFPWIPQDQMDDFGAQPYFRISKNMSFFHMSWPMLILGSRGEVRDPECWIVLFNEVGSTTHVFCHKKIHPFFFHILSWLNWLPIEFPFVFMVSSHSTPTLAMNFELFPTCCKWNVPFLPQNPRSLPCRAP